MKRSSRPRATVELSKSLNHQLNTYALAAGAAGVTALCSAQAAQATIVYTPAHTKIPLNGYVPLDLNHDGIPDFRLHNAYTHYSNGPGGDVSVVPHKSANEVWAARLCSTVTSHGYLLCAAALRKGTKIGPKGRFLPDYPDGELMAVSNFDTRFGHWFDMTRYLGLKFVIKGTVHFGWARVRVMTPKPLQDYKFRATLLGYAYETTSNKPIIAGKTKGADVVVEPATLGHLAAGASGSHVVPF